MLHPDPRGYRVALIADAVVNDPAPEYDLVGMLQEASYGMIVLPPDDFAVPTIERVVEYVVDDLVEYSKQGYRVVIVETSARPGGGVWNEVLGPELARRDGLTLERFDVHGSSSESFAAFLSPVPAALG